jgi:tetratricopeptide (TPR) repeat protein
VAALVVLLLSSEYSTAANLPGALPSPAPNAPVSGGSSAGGGLSPSIVSNATPTELRTVDGLLVGLSRSLAVSDAAALRILQLDSGEKAHLTLASIGDASLSPRLRLTHLAASAAGALARIEYQIVRSSRLNFDTAPSVAAAGTIDLWLQRTSDGTLALTDRGWKVPDDAASVLAAKANEDWQTQRASTDRKAAQPNAYITDLVAERRGGRWIPLRVSFLWQGELLDGGRLATTGENMKSSGDADAGLTGTRTPWDITPWLRRRMAQFEKENDQSNRAGTAHFLLQFGPQGWVALDAVWDTNRSMSDPKIAHADEIAQRERVNIAGQNYTLPETHRNFGAALFQLGLYNEAADALQKADALQPGLVGADTLKQVETWRARDPQRIAFQQVDQERSIGVAEEHPSKIIPSLEEQLQRRATPLAALRLGLEYSRLADDDNAMILWQRAAGMSPETMQGASEDDRAWMKLLSDQLQERTQLAHRKPPSVIRSTLFTVRCWPNDLGAARLLAGLEAAQHTIYADFGIPMSNTEVVLWRSQSEFQNYTGRMTGRETSEFVTALTMTQLVNTDKGPHVLGEEINFFADPRANTMSTIAHEYGHVAVRQLSQGRLVPDWLNEGIATAVEGGYEDYLQRVRDAARRGRLLSMQDLREWNVDGERAFLAYSQANSMVDFIKERWGGDKLLDILRIIGRDTPPDDAVRRVLKVTPQQLWNMWSAEGIK